MTTGLVQLLICGVLLLSFRTAEAPGDDPVEAESAPACRGPALRDNHPVLQRKLDDAIDRAGWRSHADRKDLAISLVDLSRPGELYYAAINDDHMLYAASLPKIAILLAAVEAVEQGELEWTPELERHLRSMIVVSSNPDAAWSAKHVGLASIADTVQDYCLYDTIHGGLWMGYGYGRGAAFQRDPVANVWNGATTRQVARFYAMLDTGVLASPHASYRMLSLMGPPKLGHKFVGGLRGKSGVSFLARKSGTWGQHHVDSALIQHHGWRYIIVGLSKTPRGEQIMRQLARIADGLIQDDEHRTGVASRPRRRGLLVSRTATEPTDS